MAPRAPCVVAGAVTFLLASSVWWMGLQSCVVMGTTPLYAEACAALEHVWGMLRMGHVAMGPLAVTSPA
jgi:hypothetical protein